MIMTADSNNTKIAIIVLHLALMLLGKLVIAALQHVHQWSHQGQETRR